MGVNIRFIVRLPVMRKFLLILVALVLICGDLFAGKKLSRDAQRALYEAQQLFKKQEYTKAAGCITTFLKKKPENPPAAAYLLLGSILYESGALQDAIHAFESGYKLFPDNYSLCLNLAIATYERESFADAAILFEKAYGLKQNPRESKLLYQAAVAWYQQEKLDQTIRVLTQLLASQKETEPEWHQLLFQSYFQQKKWNEAERAIIECLKKHPTNARYWKLLAQCRMSMDAYEAAAIAFEISYLIERPDDQELFELADIYLYLNAPLKAIRCLKRMKDISSPKIMDKITTAYIRAVRYKEAISTISDVLKTAPTSKRYFERGRLYYETGCYQEAINSFKNALLLEENHGKSSLLTGFSALELRRWEQAREAFDKALTEPALHDQASYGLTVTEEIISARDEMEKSLMD